MEIKPFPSLSTLAIHALVRFTREESNRVMESGDFVESGIFSPISNMCEICGWFAKKNMSCCNRCWDELQNSDYDIQLNFGRLIRFTPEICLKDVINVLHKYSYHSQFKKIPPTPSEIHFLICNKKKIKEKELKKIIKRIELV